MMVAGWGYLLYSRVGGRVGLVGLLSYRGLLVGYRSPLNIFISIR